VENVEFAYPGSSRLVLRGVSLEIEPGEIVALVGENGSGKTTLVKLIARLYHADRGRITLDGRDIETLEMESLHRRIAFVFQSFGRYEATARDNIAYGDWEKCLDDPDRVEEIARVAGVHEMLLSMPEGYDTMLGRTFGTFDLSGGQWQKLAMARAFARQAALLILDEASASLDARAEYELFVRARELARGRTTILISHRFSTVSMADRILVMDQGRIVESGSHRELLRRGGHYAKLYGLHQQQMGAVAGRVGGDRA
jgi:ATP-binding cassette subfamily B protein